MGSVRFYFDPRCPWCYQTSRWARRLADLGEIDLDWGFFSLEVVNRDEDVDPLALEPTGSPALRLAALVARRDGSAAVGPLYAEIGARWFEVEDRPEDQHQMLRDALEALGRDPGLLDEALADPTTWSEVVDQTLTVHELVGDVGVPTLVLDDGEGPAIFGPVIVELPSDEDAVELWRHTEWLARHASFAEIKRKRSGRPDLPAVRAAAERRARERSAG